jgi:hypothetical protein
VDDSLIHTSATSVSLLEELETRACDARHALGCGREEGVEGKDLGIALDGSDNLGGFDDVETGPEEVEGEDRGGGSRPVGSSSVQLLVPSMEDEDEFVLPMVMETSNCP